MLKFLRNLFGWRTANEAINLKPTPVYLGNIEEVYPVSQSLPMVAPGEAEQIAAAIKILDNAPVPADLGGITLPTLDDGGSQEPVAVDNSVAGGSGVARSIGPVEDQQTPYGGPDGREFPDNRPRAAGKRYGFQRVVRTLRRTGYRSEQRRHDRD